MRSFEICETNKLHSSTGNVLIINGWTGQSDFMNTPFIISRNIHGLGDPDALCWLLPHPPVI